MKILTAEREALQRDAKTNRRRVFDEPGYRAWGGRFDYFQRGFFESLGHASAGARHRRWPDFEQGLDDVRRQLSTWHSSDHTDAMLDGQRGQAIRHGRGQERTGHRPVRPRPAGHGPER